MPRPLTPQQRRLKLLNATLRAISKLEKENAHYALAPLVNAAFKLNERIEQHESRLESIRRTETYIKLDEQGELDQLTDAEIEKQLLAELEKAHL